MKKKFLLLLMMGIIIITGCNNKENSIIKEDNFKEEVNNLKITINNKEYELLLEDNETVQSLIKQLPLDLTMNELNGNEKYVYLEESFPINPDTPNKIEIGDVMLYGNNCLVIFYKSFNTTYQYTKIGHINNLEDLGNKDIKVRIEN